MRTLLASLFIVACSASSIFGALIPGTATSMTTTTASGVLDGIGWTAVTTSTSPFIGINLPTGTWDVTVNLPENGLFLGTGYVNAGDTQQFFFDQPVSNLCFFIENFDSNSAASITTDGVVSVIAASSSISFNSTSVTLNTSNASFDGEGDVILSLSSPTTFIQFDYSDGIDANGVFYGFAIDNQVAAVPEPSSFLFLLLCGSSAAYVRRFRNRLSAGLMDVADRQ
jgi:hypothetical protein